MSDDEEGRLHIDEMNSSDDQAQDNGREDGEIDDDDVEMPPARNDFPLPPKRSLSPHAHRSERKTHSPDSRTFDKNSEDGRSRTPSSTKKKKEHKEKEKSRSDTTPSSSRSKRASHHLATAAIAACLNDDEPRVSGLEMSFLPKKPRINQTPREVSTGVTQTRATDTTETTSILDMPPGSTFFIEVQVVCKATPNSIFVTLKNEDLTAVISDGMPPMAGALMRKRPPTNGNEDSKDRERSLSSASTSATPAKGFRGPPGSQNKRGGPRGLDSKRKLSYAVKEGGEEEDVDIMGDDSVLKMEPEPTEIDIRAMHKCHFDGCENYYPSSTELEYHIIHRHEQRKVMHESICCQTDVSYLRQVVADKATETNALDFVYDTTNSKGVLPRIESPAYSDLSDDGPPPNLAKEQEADKIKSQEKNNSILRPTALSGSMSNEMPAASALMGIAAASGSSAPTQTVVANPQNVMIPNDRKITPSNPIGIAMPQPTPPPVARPTASNPVQQPTPTATILTPSPRAAPQSSQQQQMLNNLNMMNYPFAHFMPIAAQGMQMPPMVAPQAVPSPVVQQVSRAPSRDHKIHELKAKEERPGGTTPKTMPSPAASAPATSMAAGRGQFVMPQMMQANASQAQMMHNLQQMHMLGGRGYPVPADQFMQQFALMMQQQQQQQQQQQHPQFPMFPKPS